MDPVSPSSSTQFTPWPESPLDQIREVGQRVSSLWQRLLDRHTEKKQDYVDAQRVGSNGGVPCPAHSVVSVEMASGTEPIHANIIRFFRDGFSGSKSSTENVNTHTAIAAQSPQDYTLCEKFLIQGIDSGRGLFQFVFRKTHAHSLDRTNETNGEVTIIDQLTDQLAACRQKRVPLHLGGRYEVVSIEPVAAEQTYCRVMLSVQDLADPNKKIIKVPLTQAGLKFTSNLLRAKQIEEADALLTAHKACLIPDGAGTQRLLEDPLIASLSGIGRNAALICYREVRARLAAIPADKRLDVHWLDEVLIDVITTGRRDRGKGFIHSDAQILELKTALVEHVQQHNNAVSRERSKSPPARNKRAHLSSMRPEDCVNPSPIPAPVASAAVAASTDIRSTTSTQLITLLESEKDKPPLDLIDAVYRIDPIAGAFCAVQDRRMNTAHLPLAPNMKEVHVDSMHEDVSCGGWSENALTHSEHELRIQNDITDRGVAPSDVLATVLLKDLATATQTEAPVVSGVHDKADSVFPAGLAAALRVGRRDVMPDTIAVAQKLDSDGLRQCITQPYSSELALVESLAPNNPHAAAFVNFASHALLIKNSLQSEPTERYEYLQDTYDMSRKIRDTNNPFLPTFLDGVQRSFHPAKSASPWQILIDGQWHPAQTRQQVVQHVLFQALEHLHTDQPTHADMPIYPLVAYEMLAAATGLTVPPYLIEHEQKILDGLAKNQRTVDQRKQRNAILQQKKEQYELDRPRREAAEQRTFAEQGVRTDEELWLCNRGFPRTLSAQSVDTTLVLPSDATFPTHQRELTARLAQSHDMQEISATTQQFHHLDNNCWLRSSWLSVLSMTSPEELADRLRACAEKPTPATVENGIAVVAALSRLYHADPVAFTHGAEHAGTAPAEQRHRSARLDAAGILKDALDTDTKLGGPNATTEGFLLQLQLKIVAAYRNTDPAFMAELVALQLSNPPASSNLPVMLHRALGLPVLVIETGASVSDGQAGQQINYSGQIRVAAPNGSALAQQLARWNEQMLPPEQLNARIEFLLNQFSNIPVLWLAQNHYSLFMPKTPLGPLRTPVDGEPA